MALLLRFEGELELGVTTSSDGESIRVTRKPVSPYPEDDPEMDVMPEEQTESEDWAFFVGKKCEDVHEVRDMSFGGKGTWVGLELHFEGGAILYAYNWGDELLLEAPPEDAVFLERKSVRKKPGEDGDDADDEDTGGKDSGKRRSRKRTSGQDDGDAGEDDSDDDESEDDSDDDQGSDDSGDGDGDDESDGDDGEGRPRRRPRRRRSRSRRGKKESSGEG